MSGRPVHDWTPLRWRSIFRQEPTRRRPKDGSGVRTSLASIPSALSHRGRRQDPFWRGFLIASVAGAGAGRRRACRASRRGAVSRIGGSLRPEGWPRIEPTRRAAGAQCLLFIVFGSLALISSSPARSDNEQSDVMYLIEGFVESDFRFFPASPEQEGQSEVLVAPSIALSPEFRRIWNQGRTQIFFNPFVRLESGAYDPERNHIDVRELSFSHFGDDWWINAGVSKVFWGRLESRRIVDIINQTDLVDSVDPDDKLGQPMLNLGIQTTVGAFEAFLLPYFRTGTFPGREGRLRGPFPVDTESVQAVFDSSLKERNVDFAFRYSANWSDYDLGLSLFRGTGREPRVTLGLDDSDRLVLIPNYDLITHVSMDAQATLGALLLKGEGYHRRGNAGPFTVFGVGFEYTFFTIFDSESDLGFLAEYLYDGRGEKAPPTNFDDEAFVGLRWTANDLDNTSFLLGTLIDVNTGSQSIGAEFETRLTDNIKIELRGQAFKGVSQSEQVLFAARKDHNIQITLSYFF